MQSRYSALIGGLLLAVPLVSHAAPLQYIISDPLSLYGSDTYAYDVNDYGQITGGSKTESGVLHAYFGDASGLIDIHDAPGTGSQGFGINNNGQVTGDTRNASNQNRGFIWDAANGMSLLGTLGGTHSNAHGINDNGVVVGYSSTAAGEGHAFTGTASGLDDRGQYLSYTDGRGINNNGTIVGTNPTSKFIAINTGGTSWTYVGSGYAMAINDNDTITGFSQSGLFNRNAIIGSLADGITTLATLGGYTQGHDINNLDQVVGMSGGYATLWDENQLLYNLNDLVVNLAAAGWTRLHRADGISDTGYITGTGVDANGQQRAFILTPYTGSIPLPSVLFLFGLGLALLGLLSRRPA